MGAAGGLAAVGVVYSNTGRSHGRPYSSAPAFVYHAPPRAAFEGARKEAARQVAVAFVEEAVLRQHVERSWELAAPELRSGYTRAHWATGSIPVVPFPARALKNARWRVAYSYRDRVGLEVLLEAKEGSGERSAAFDMELKAYGTGARAHWLVSSWVPKTTLNPPPAPGVAAARGPAGSGLGAVWLAVPFAIFGGALLLLLALVARGWYQGHRALRAYEARARRLGSEPGSTGRRGVG